MPCDPRPNCPLPGKFGVVLYDERWEGGDKTDGYKDSLQDATDRMLELIRSGFNAVYILNDKGLAIAGVGVPEDYFTKPM